MPGTTTTDVMEEEANTEPASGSDESEQLNKNVPTKTDLGKGVLFYSTDNKERHGTLRYYGQLEFAGGVWCGIELDEASGRNNGSARGIRYFSCEQDHGIFVQLSRVELSKRPSKSGLTRSSSFHNVYAGVMHRKMSVPVTGMSKPSKGIPHLRKPKAGLLKKSRSEWDLLSGGTNKTNRGGGGLSRDRKKELGSYSDLKTADSNGGSSDLLAMKRRMLRPTASCANLITINTVKRGDDEEETDREEWSVNTRSHSVTNWPRTSTPDQARSNGAEKRGNTSSSSDSDRTPITSPTTSTSLQTQYPSTLNMSPNSPTSPTATKLDKFNRSTDDVFTSHPARVPAPTGLATHSSHIIESLRGADSNGPVWSAGNRRTHQSSRSAPTTPSHHVLMNGGTTRDGGGKIFTRPSQPVTDVATQNSHITTESLLARIVQLEQIVKDTQTLIQSQAAAFTQQINNVESRLQAKLNEAAKEHKEQLQRLTVDHDEEMRVLQMAHQVNLRDMWKEEHLGTEC